MKNKKLLWGIICAVVVIAAVLLIWHPWSTQPAQPSEPAATEAPLDLDLTKLSGTVAYSQVYDMLSRPDAYMGQRIRMNGSFSYYRDENTKQEYFATIIADATACCAQGIEFLWAGEHAFPDDYPPLDTEITVTGTFGTYEENGYTYLRLSDAEVTWEKT